MKLQTILHEAGGLRLQRQSPNVKAKLANARQQQMAVADKFNTNPPAAATAAPAQQPAQPSSGITAANAMEKIPELMQKHAGDQDFIKAIVSTVATAVSQGSEIWGQALQQAQMKKNQQQQGIRGSGQKKTPQDQALDALARVSNLSPEAKKLFQTGVGNALQSSGTKQRANEAVQPQQPPPAQQAPQPTQAQAKVQPATPAVPAGGINKQAQQAILAQIKAAVQGMNKEQRKVLKARVQQAALLKGQKADPNKLMRHGQPVVGRAGIDRQPSPGMANIAKTGLKKFLGMK